MATRGLKNFEKNLTANIAKWFPSSHGGVSGIRDVERNLYKVDCVIEVHDARAPVSGRNEQLFERLRYARPHVLVLNKADLIPKNIHTQIQRALEPTSVLFASAKTGKGIDRIIPQAVNLIEDQTSKCLIKNPAAVENSKAHYTLMVAGVPNVGKSSIINSIRSLYTGLNNQATRVGALPGITRKVLEVIRVSEHPKVYLVDTPGVIEAKPVSLEAALRLALCGNALDHVVGEQLMAAYLLNFLQQRKIYSYVPYMGLDSPTDSLRTLLETSATTLNSTRKVRGLSGYDIKLNLDAAAKHFIGAFRRGEFGPICLDDQVCSGET